MANTPDSDSKNDESFVQPGRQFTLDEIVEELPGLLRVSPDPVAAGGYAEIYVGIWTNLQAEKIQVAVKQFKRPIPRDKHADQEKLERRRETRIKREVFVWSQTKHSNLHPLLGYRSQPQPSLISRWCRHGNLWEYLKGSPDLSRLDKLKLVYEVACGLNHLHTQTPPICHGDIKPENVLINDQLEAVLSDFGLGRVLMGLSLSTGLTTSDAAHGTVSYMAGELLNEETSRSNCETDVYAFGGLVLAVMSGKPPFDGVQRIHIIVRVMKNQHPKLEDHPELRSSDPLWGLMRRCWEQTPAARPVMKDVVVELPTYIFSEQSNRTLRVSGIAEELPGDLEVPSRPELCTDDAVIYHGTWTNTNGQKIEVAIREMRIPIARSRLIDLEAFEKRLDMRMKREALAWSQIEHPNIYPLFGYRSGPRPRFINPWYRHGNLLDHLNANPHFSRLDKLKLIYQTACGLDYLHTRTPPICHYDIRPENVLINDQKEATLFCSSFSGVMMDLGISLGSGSGAVEWTLNYKAREVFLDEDLRDTPQTDVYAFGGLVLRVMSGKAPFGGIRNPNRIIENVLRNRKPRSEDHPGMAPSDPLWDLMGRCWDGTLAARPTMQETLSELWKSISRESYSEPPSGHTADLSVVKYLSIYLDDSEEDEVGEPLASSVNCPPVGDSLSSVTDLEETANSTSGAKNSIAWKTLKSLELESQDIPVVGKYIGDAVEVGLTLLNIVRAISANGDVSANLESNACKLADLLEDLRELSRARQVEDAALRITDTQRELQSVNQKLWDWCYSGLLKEAFSSCDSMEPREGEDMVRDVLGKIQLLIKANTAGLITELGHLEK